MLADDVVAELLKLDDRIMSVSIEIAQPDTTYMRRLTLLKELEMMCELRHDLAKFDDVKTQQRDGLFDKVRRVILDPL